MKTLLCMLALAWPLMAQGNDPLDVYRATVRRPGVNLKCLDALSPAERASMAHLMATQEGELWLIQQELARKDTHAITLEALHAAVGRPGADKRAWERLGNGERVLMARVLRTETGLQWLRVVGHFETGT